ncbi:MAG: sel1 repeat family protein [Ruminococcus sp.]|nr:sel1 repeat family protein [Ruminococcus sp.]MCM1478718.1 sel1 repeat family protein [Muribaculaceae bacterium]
MKNTKKEYTVNTQTELADTVGEILNKMLDTEGKALIMSSSRQAEPLHADYTCYKIYLCEGKYALPYQIKKDVSFLEKEPNIEFIGLGSPEVYVPENDDNYNIKDTRVIRNLSDYKSIWLETAEQGNAVAQYEVGCHHGAECKLDEHLKWVEKSAETGYVLAQLIVGMLYHTGGEEIPEADFRIEKDDKKAKRFILSALNQKCEMARVILSEFYIDGLPKDDTERFKWDLEFSEYGIARAQCSLGICYLDGIGTAPNKAEGVKLISSAAEKENAVAQFTLGRLYQRGDGVEKDIAKAFAWYMKAARQDYDKAQNAVGNCYYHGGGTNRDYNEAFSWYLKAAMLGNSFAQNNVALCYRDGKGVKTDKDEADKWFRKSCSGGDKNAVIDLSEITLK